MDPLGRALNLPLSRTKPSLAHKHEEAATYPDCSDEELLEQISNQDTGSILALFRRYNKLAFSIGYRVLRDEGEAEDFVQEVFLRLCSEANSFDRTRGSARPWMIQMIYRRALDRRAYLYRRNFYSGTDDQEQTNTLTGARNPENEMIDRLTAQQLKAAFSRLNAKQRKTLEMFFFEGLTLSEIADKSNEDVKNVRHYYYRGLERLRQLARQIQCSESMK